MSDYIIVAGRATIDKDPEASLLYGINVADIIEPGDALNGTPGASAMGVTVGAASFSGTVIKARCSSGPPAGTTAGVTFTWVTVSGDTDQRTIYLRGVER
jgi:hypothetical protein